MSASMVMVLIYAVWIALLPETGNIHGPRCQGMGLGFLEGKKGWFMVSWVDHAGTLTATISPTIHQILVQPPQQFVAAKLLAAPSALGPKAIANFAPSVLVP